LFIANESHFLSLYNATIANTCLNSELKIKKALDLKSKLGSHVKKAYVRQSSAAILGADYKNRKYRGYCGEVVG